MARRKEREKPANTEHVSVKCGLGSVLRQQFRLPLINIISALSITATNIAVLGSLLLLYKVNTAIDDNYRAFFLSNGTKTIYECFKAVLVQNKDDELMIPTFRDLVEGFNIQWPNNIHFHNAFNYLVEQYETNVKTNLNTHCQSRLRKFFTMRVYELNENILRANQFNEIFGDGDMQEPFGGTDIKNAINFAYEGKNTARGPDEQFRLDVLINDLRLLGAPDDCTIKEFTESKWFQSIEMWLQVQREIEMFHLAFADTYRNWNLYHADHTGTVPMPTEPQPPKITNFAVVPMCTFQRRHVRIDTWQLYDILCQAKLCPRKITAPRKNSKTGKNGTANISSGEFNANQMASWSLYFDIDKINQLVKHKKIFDCQIVSDGVSVSLLFSKPTTEAVELTNEEVCRRYDAGEFAYELGIDPGMRTWNATVRRDVWTGEEVNLKISSKRYHWQAKQGVRNSKAERMDRLFKFEEQCDRNAVAASIGGQTPSPRSKNWLSYIEHRLSVMNDGIKTYTERGYARLSLDKHIESHRAIDELAGKLVNHKAAIIHMGRADVPPNSPIKIKKHVRCPGNRKLIGAFNKRGNCVVRLVDEWMTSQHCGRCFRRYPRNTRRYRFKNCDECHPNPIVWLPDLIVTNVSKRALQMNRTIERAWRQMRQMGDAVAATFKPANTGRLVSTKQRFVKNWQPNNVNVGMEDEAAQPQPPIKTVWHRDISAAKLILYRGHCELHGMAIHPALLRTSYDRHGNFLPNAEEP